MATYVNNFRTGYKLECEVTTKSQNVANNTSVINVKVYLTSTGSSYTINSSVQKGGTILINGIDYGFYCYVSLSGNQRKLLHEADFTITHNSDGTKSFSVSARVGINVTLSGVYWGNVTTSGTYTPARIPRASDFTLSTTNVTFGSTQLTVNISRVSSTFTHKVYYQIQNSNHNAWLVNSNSSVGTSISFTPGTSDCQYLPNSVSGTAKITVDTYSGGTWIGSASKTITVKVPDSVVPTISNYSLSETGSGIGQYVKGKSKVQVSYSCAAGNGASISSKTTTITGLSSNSNTSFTSGIFTSSGTKTITTTVKDSRGRTATKTSTISVLDYAPPAFSLKAVRCDIDGNEDLTNGEYIRATYSLTSFSSLGGSNAVSWKVAVKSISDNGTWTEKNSGADTLSSTTEVISADAGGIYDTNKMYQVRMQVTDKFGTYTTIADIPTAYVTMDFLQGGKGIAFGKVASLNDTFECNMHGQFNRALKTTRGTYCHQAGGKGGESGYIKFCTIKIISTYADSPLRIIVGRREDLTPKEISLKWENVGDSNDPNLASFRVYGIETSMQFFIHKSATSTWDLYAIKNGTWDNIGVFDVQMSKYLADKIEILWHSGTQVSEPPSGSIYATPYNSGLLPYSGNWFNNGTPIISQNGGMEIGKYIDFHLTSSSTSDYNARISCDSDGHFNIYAWLHPGQHNKYDIGGSSNRWRYINLVNSPNVSSDRTLKENISYVNSKARTTNQITYTDMYNFVKDDLELAEYNFKNDDEPKMNFIAQDLLYNIDGSDNKVGQMIVRPISPPTVEEIEEAKSNLEEGKEYEYPTLSYDMGMYISVLAGALKTALNKIDVLENQIQVLQENINNKEVK